MLVAADGGLGVGGVAGFVDSGALRQKGCRIFAVFGNKKISAAFTTVRRFHRAEEDEI
jgi:hypothetical protein